MKQLEAAILQHGHAVTRDILDVSEFLNSTIDVELMQAIGKDFADHFQAYDFDLFVTVESSGIAPSVFASLYAEKPLVIIKKENIVKDEARFVQQECFSFTKQNTYYLSSPKQPLHGKRIILLDDFLAQGNVVLNVEKLLQQIDATLVAVGICISKNFQPGYQKLKQQNYNLYVQAQLAHLEPETNTIVFV